jgi:hypothetical protein
MFVLLGGFAEAKAISALFGLIVKRVTVTFLTVLSTSYFLSGVSPTSVPSLR